jgi:iron complex transport system permease protein
MTLSREAPVLLWCLALAALLLLGMALSFCLGEVSIPLGEIPGILRGEEDSLRREILVNLRLPRAVAGALCGLSLAVCGTAMQAVVKNPLADPYLMGVSSGAGLGAAASILWLGAAGPALPAAAFAGALAAGAAVFAMGASSRAPVWRLILAGLAMNVLCSSLMGLLVYYNPDPQRLQMLSFWLMGSLAPAEWGVLAFPAAAALAGSAFFIAQRRNLNLVCLDDDEALSLGAEPRRLRLVYLAWAALMTASVTAYFGIIGFVGLVVPHIARFLLGFDHARLVPAAGLAGALFMVLVDMLARLSADAEIPLGVITGAVGSPFFFWLLLKPQRKRRGEG